MYVIVHGNVAIITKPNQVVKRLADMYSSSKKVKKYILFTREQFIERCRVNIQVFDEFVYTPYCKNPELYIKSSYLNFDSRYQEIFFKEVSKSADPAKVIDKFSKIKNFSDDEVYNYFIYSVNKSNVGENGEIYSTVNPKAKMDGYSFHSNSAKVLLVKKGVEAYSYKSHKGLTEHLGAYMNLSEPKSVKGYEWTDIAKIKNVEWDIINNLNRDELSTITAVITSDGKWYSCEDYDDWEQKLKERFFDSVDPDYLTTVLDYHF